MNVGPHALAGLMAWATLTPFSSSAVAQPREPAGSERDHRHAGKEEGEEPTPPKALDEGGRAKPDDPREGGQTAGRGEPWHAFRSRLRFGDPDRVRFSMPGEMALRLIYQTDLKLSAVPTDRPNPDENILRHNRLGQNLYSLSWVRARPELAFSGRFRLVGQIDVLHGHLAGDDTYEVDPARDERSGNQALSLDGIRPRFLYLEWDTGVGVLRVGQMGSNWGMGLLANDGDRACDYLFGDYRYGDIVERVVFATKPFYRVAQGPIRELAVFAGADLVFNDGTANLMDGDLAWQAVGGLLWRLGPHRAVGVYVAYRNQTYSDGDFLDVTAMDFYGEWGVRLSSGILGYLQTEVVGIVGETNAAPNLATARADVRQLGAVARIGARLYPYGLDLRVEGGYTSGDADSNDGYVNRFTADPDYRVGLILFPELLAWSTARTADLAGNEELVGEVQDGAELLPTNGGVAGATYVYPSVVWGPVDWLDIRFATLLAYATSDVVSPFETKRRGTGSSFRGAPAENRYLGVELDVGAYAKWDLRYVQIRGGVEGAWCRPGSAFDDAAGDRHPDIWMVRSRLTLDW